MFCRKDVLKNLTKLTGKHMCQSLFFRPQSTTFPIDTGRTLNVYKTFIRRPGRLIYVQFTSCVDWFIKKETLVRVFFCEILRRWLLLYSVSDINPLSANPTKKSITLRQSAGKSRRIFLACLTIFLVYGDFHII